MGGVQSILEGKQEDLGVQLYPKLAYRLEEDLSLSEVRGGKTEHICNEIQEACKGWGTDEEKVLKVMGELTPDMRCKVPMCYKYMFDKELKDVIKSECGERAFGQALQFLSVQPVEAECLMINEACDGVGTNEKVLCSILCGRTNKELELLKKKYFEIYSKDLGQEVSSELGGKLESLVMNVLQADQEEFDTNYHTRERMEEDAENLYKMSQGEIGSDEVGFFKILVKSPPKYLRKLNTVYADKYGLTLPKVLNNEFGGDLDFAASFMLGMKMKPMETIAGLIEEAVDGFGTKELLLTSALIRYQLIMKEVSREYSEHYNKSIQERLRSEAGGEYGKLLEIIYSTGMQL